MDDKQMLLETIYTLKMAHEKQLKPFYDMLVRLEETRTTPIFIPYNDAMNGVILDGMAMIKSDGVVIKIEDLLPPK